MTLRVRWTMRLLEPACCSSHMDGDRGGTSPPSDGGEWRGQHASTISNHLHNGAATHENRLRHRKPSPRTTRRDTGRIVMCALLLLVLLASVPAVVFGTSCPIQTSPPNAVPGYGCNSATTASGATCNFECYNGYHLIGASLYCNNGVMIGQQQCLSQNWQNEGLIYPNEVGRASGAQSSILMMPAGSAGSWRNTALPPDLAIQALNRPFYLVIRSCAAVPCLSFLVTFDSVNFYPFTPTVVGGLVSIGYSAFNSGFVAPTYGSTGPPYVTIWLPMASGEFDSGRLAPSRVYSHVLATELSDVDFLSICVSLCACVRV